MRAWATTILAGVLITPFTVISQERKEVTLKDWLGIQKNRLQESGKPSEKLSAIDELQKLRSATEGGVSALVEALADTDDRVRFAAARALVHLGPLAAERLTAILPYVDPTDPRGDHVGDELRCLLLQAIQQMGSDAHNFREHETIPIIVRQLRHENPKVRCLAAQALGAAGHHARAAVPELIQALDDLSESREPGRVSVRFCVIVALSNIGAEAAPAVPKLLNILNTSPLDSGAVLNALGGIGTAHPNVVPMLITLMNESPKLGHRESAVFQLGRIGSEAKAAIPRLIEVLRQKEPAEAKGPIPWPRDIILKVHHYRLQRTVLHSLGLMGPAAKEAVPILTNFAAGRRIPDDLRGTALKSLERLGPLAKEAVPDLILMLKEGADVGAAIVAIGKVAVPALVQVLKQSEEGPAKKALYILARMGPDAEAARAAISSMQKHPQLGDTAVQVLAHLDKFRRQ